MARSNPARPALLAWSRVGPRLAFVWLLVWAAAWLLAGATGVDAGSARLVWVHVGFGGFGFAGHLVLGLGFRLDAAFNRRQPVPLMAQRLTPIPLSVTALLVGSAFHPAADWARPDVLLGVASWCLLLAGAGIGAVALTQARKGAAPDLVAAVAAPGPYAATDQASRLLVPAAAAYAVAAGVAAVWLGVLHAAVIHLWLAGFVTTAVFAVAHRALPRFSHMAPRPRLHLAQAFAASVGPALLAWGIANASSPYAVAGGIAELAAAVLYLVLAARAWRARRGPQPALPLMLAGSVALVGGMLLGLGFLAHAALRTNLALHAINNLVGFVSLTILGTGSAMLGTGVRPVPGSVNRNVWLMAAGLAIPLVAWEVQAGAAGALGATGSSAGQEILWLAVVALAVHGVFGLKALRLPKR